jgi:hypothetical protein
MKIKIKRVYEKHQKDDSIRIHLTGYGHEDKQMK